MLLPRLSASVARYGRMRKEAPVASLSLRVGFPPDKVRYHAHRHPFAPAPSGVARHPCIPGPARVRTLA